MKHLQHTSETSATLETDACNMCFQVQHLLVPYKMEACRHVAFTGSSHAIATIDRSTPPATRPARTPSWLLLSTRSPRSGSGGRSSEAEWGEGARCRQAVPRDADERCRAMRANGASGLIRPSGRPARSNHYRFNMVISMLLLFIGSIFVIIFLLTFRRSLSSRTLSSGTIRLQRPTIEVLNLPIDNGLGTTG